MHIKDPIEGEIVDILSMCGEHFDELITMFEESSEVRLANVSGSVPKGVQEYLQRLRSQGVVTTSSIDEQVWELTELGRTIATDRNTSRNLGRNPDT